MGTGSFPAVKRPGRGVDHPSCILPRLKKEYSCTSTSPLSLHGLLFAFMFAGVSFLADKATRL